MNLDKLYELNPQAIVWDGLDEAIVGMATKTIDGPIVVTYVEDDNFETFEVVVKDELENFDRWGRMEYGPIIVYSTDKIIDILIEQMVDENDSDSDTFLNALEYFEFNIDGAYVGEFTPLHLPMIEESE